MYFISRNLYITIIVALGLAISHPLAASDKETLNDENLRLKILGISPADNVPMEVPGEESLNQPVSDTAGENHSIMPGMMGEEKRMMEAAHAPAGIKIQNKNAHHSEVHWSYEGNGGPYFWGEMKNEFATCKTGKNQSPIDISAAIVTELSEIKFDYNDSPLHIINNGHTIQVNYQPGSTLSIGTTQFELLQFHFHSPSEHTIGGKGYPMVAHLVHKTAGGQLGVIGVLLKEGRSNTLIEKLWAHLPQNAGEESALEGENINAIGLLPKDMTYFNYSGSLTTPPCTEGVNWMLLAAPTELSTEQIAQFTALYKSNARPVQAVNGRPIGLSN